ncbi:flagellar hook assembly protein FlgD [Asticcacaulis taihuensis]|uniref:Basal-body rod modification protein FlgD n=1 Tax=Asticcacaulis taihuensis TaxID=260084 RepID=A0A1G4RDE8_9CAUL|nr:flagellar hook capping FlgD N-terminal domain-containing protein [Asticcacaulis taihuensis]SCW54750.1 flagellar basal-body rod modification protein FlgD [Asticcacaulis taihuensis]
MVTSVANTNSASNPTSNTAADSSKFSTDYTTFLNLLTAQVKNQDPLSPMDTTEWTNQLVQYSSVEQQIKANGYLETIANASGASGSMTSAVNYIGKTIGSDEPTATLTDGGSATWNYTLGSTATSATLTIKDADGKTVWSDSADDLTAGTHSFAWDGKDSSGNAVGAGKYTLSVSAANADGAIDASAGLTGIVTSAQTENGSTVLKIGNSSVSLDSITSVS